MLPIKFFILPYLLFNWVDDWLAFDPVISVIWNVSSKFLFGISLSSIGNKLLSKSLSLIKKGSAIISEFKGGWLSNRLAQEN